jgi:hypothetical protein
MSARSMVLVAGLIISVLVGLLVPLPVSRSAGLQETPTCGCVISSVITSHPSQYPACFDKAIVSIQNMANGTCNVGNCSAQIYSGCTFEITITALAKSGQVCDLSIRDNNVQVAFCSSCASLGYTPPTDPVAVRCDASNNGHTYGVGACVAGSAPSGCGNGVETIDFYCDACSP